MNLVAPPEEGQTFVVSAAASAEGSIAGQLAKLRGARVIGIAGGPAKVRWVTEDLGIDACIDYKREDVADRRKELAPGAACPRRAVRVGVNAADHWDHYMEASLSSRSSSARAS